jgi:hypothetical protein
MITPEVLAAYKAKNDVTIIPNSVFRIKTDAAICKKVRPPTNKDLGKHLRKVKWFEVSEPIFDETKQALEVLPDENTSSGVLQSEPAKVLTTKTTATHETLIARTQDPDSIAKLFRLETKMPKIGLGASKLKYTECLDVDKENKSGGPATQDLEAANPKVSNATQEPQNI